MGFDENQPESSGPLVFRAVRGDGRHYQTWQDYALASGGDTAASLSTIILRSRPRWFAGQSGSQDHAVGTSSSDTPAVTAEEGPEREWRTSASQVPWITFVLGSGCLSAWDSVTGADATKPDFHAVLRDSLRSICSHFPALYLDDLVVSYAEALVKERTGDEEATLADVNVRTDIQPPYYSSRVLLAATLVTRLYAALLHTSMHVLGRADREEVTIDLSGADAGVIGAEILSPLSEVLRELADTHSDRSSQQAMSKLAEAITVSIQRHVLRRTHVELLTAFSWYFLTEGTTVYPGWSELMLFQALEDDNVFMDPSVLATDSNLRPRMSDVREQADWVYRRIVKVTNDSWQSRDKLVRGTGPDLETERDRFYDLIARLVDQQAKARNHLPDRGIGAPPLPVCFVTSFDLELEMALWASGIDFIVVLPVFAVEDNHGDSTSVHWLWAKVCPEPMKADFAGIASEEDDAAQSPAFLMLPDGLVNPSEWKRLVRGTLPAEISGGTCPVIVRLTGSPLMSLPAAGALKLPRSTVGVRHALVLDEYTAINQSAQDLRQLGLPRELTEQRASGAPRFWMMLGAQVGDTGVRLRLMAQQLAARMKNSTKSAAVQRLEESAPTMTRMGVLINDKSQNSDRDLFLWHDFDVVDGRHTDRLGDLERLHADVEAALKNVEAKSGRVADQSSARTRGVRA